MFSTLGTKRPRQSPVTCLADYEKFIFRNIIYNFHKTEHTRITVNDLRLKLQQDLGWNGGSTSLGLILTRSVPLQIDCFSELKFLFVLIYVFLTSFDT